MERIGDLAVLAALVLALLVALAALYHTCIINYVICYNI